MTIDHTGYAVGRAILPLPSAGQEFGRAAEELTVRLAYVNFDGARVLEAAGRLAPDADPDESFLQLHCGETLEAVDRICNWVDG